MNSDTCYLVRVTDLSSVPQTFPVLAIKVTPLETPLCFGQIGMVGHPNLEQPSEHSRVHLWTPGDLQNPMKITVT